MTNSASAPPFAPSNHATHSSHTHSHHRPLHSHNEDVHRQNLPDGAHSDLRRDTSSDDSDSDSSRPLPREPQAADPAAVDDSNLVTQVVQTVSLIAYVDSAGSAIQTQTFYAPPNTVVIDTVLGSTITISSPEDSVTAAASAPSPTANDPVDSGSEPPAPTSEPVSSDPSSSLISSEPVPPVSDPAASPSSSEVTSAPLPTSAFPSFAGSQNSTNSVSSHSLPSNSTTLSFLVASSLSTGSISTESDASRTQSGSSTRTKSISDSILSTVFPSSTGVNNEGGFGGDAGGTGGVGDGAPAPTGTSESDSDNSGGSGLSPQEKQVIGGVVGSVAGIAVIAVLLLWLLKYRKRGNNPLMFGDDSAPGARAMITGAGPTMSERSGPFAVTAALASLNKKAPAAQGEPSGERGFYRVSGKKLPSVLYAGGDGYSDPRESVVSGNSDYYRGSQEFNPAADGNTRLTLGTPMRPMSGVPIMRSGPGRGIAVTEPNPFADPPSPPPPPDPVGRSLIGQDGSRGSGSRFHERI